MGSPTAPIAAAAGRLACSSGGPVCSGGWRRCGWGVWRLGGEASDSEVAMGLCECMVSCETNKRVA